MRVLWISLAIFCIFITFSIYFTSSLEKSSHEIVAIIEEMEKEVKKKDWEGIREQFNNLRKQWDEMSSSWKIFIDHEELDTIQISMIKVEEYITVKDENSTRAEVSVLKFLVRHIYTKDKLNIENIF